MTDTIFAVSSGTPPAAIAILRISGPGALDALRSLAGAVPPPRVATLRALRGPEGALLDRALLLVFPGPDSATGEDMVELHLHGGRATIAAVEAALSALPGLRPALPGEFTRRAMANGRIDLSEAEGLGDLLSAETEAQRRAAIDIAEGGLRRLIEQWTDRALSLAAGVEAVLDHGDEEDVGDADAVVSQVRSGVALLAGEIATIVAQPPAERLRDGIVVVLAGPPNSGKSTLFNALVGRDAAIVSSTAGTTRDRIEAQVVQGGVAWRLTDTAGLAEETDDAIEAIGIERAHRAMESADIVLWLGDEAPPEGQTVIALHPRADVPDREVSPPDRIAVSALSGDVATVWTALHAAARDMLPRPNSLALNARQHALCGHAAEALEVAGRETDPLLVAEGLRIALRQFDAIGGRAGVESMLDALFARFCIGK